jgi:hypothetical protein
MSKPSETMSAADFKAYMNRKHAAKKPGAKKQQTESKLQTACVRWFRIEYPKYSRLLFAIPNGVRLHGTEKERMITWNRLAKEGAVAGAADLFLSVPSHGTPGLYIEMKTEKGRQSEKQKLFERDAVKAGYGYAIPRSEKEFRQVVKMYLATGEY